MPEYLLFFVGKIFIRWLFPLSIPIFIFSSAAIEYNSPTPLAIEYP